MTDLELAGEQPDQVLAGELLSRVEHDGPCQLRQWTAGRWYRWECTGPGHTGRGEHRTERGRELALREHADQVAAARAAGQLVEWVPM